MTRDLFNLFINKTYEISTLSHKLNCILNIKKKTKLYSTFPYPKNSKKKKKHINNCTHKNQNTK